MLSLIGSSGLASIVAFASDGDTSQVTEAEFSVSYSDKNAGFYGVVFNGNTDNLSVSLKNLGI